MPTAESWSRRNRDFLWSWVALTTLVTLRIVADDTQKIDDWTQRFHSPILPIVIIIGGLLLTCPAALLLTVAFRLFRSGCRIVPWRNLGAPAALVGFAYLNSALFVTTGVATRDWPGLVALPLGLAIILLPLVALYRPVLGVTFPPGLAKAGIVLAIPVMISVLSAYDGTRTLLLARQGQTVAGVTPDEVPDLVGAAGYEFAAGCRGRGEFFGVAKNIHGDAVDIWIVIPFVAEAWAPDQPVTVWALSYGERQPEVLEGRFQAGFREDERADRFHYARKAVEDAVARHRLTSHPRAVILRMGESAGDLVGQAVFKLFFGFGLANFCWGIAALWYGGRDDA